MDGELVLLAGLPGSGKTNRLCEMQKDGWLVFDDFKANAFGNDPYFSRSRKFRSLISAIADNLKCVVADIDFCNPVSRGQADSVLLSIFPEAEIVWQFFENDPSACEANIRRRGNAGVQEELCKLRKFAALYEIPQGVNPLPVFRNTNQRGTEN